MTEQDEKGRQAVVCIGVASILGDQGLWGGALALLLSATPAPNRGTGTR